MSSNRKHIQFLRNTSATTFDDASKLLVGEIALGLKPGHEKLFIKNSQGTIASFSSDAALNSLRDAIGIAVSGNANDESVYSTQVPYVSGNTTMFDTLNDVAVRAKYAIPTIETKFNISMATEDVGLETIVSPKFSFDISFPVQDVTVTKIENGVYTSIYTGNTQAYSGDVTVTNVTEEYVLEFTSLESSNLRIQETLPLNLCCLTSSSDETLTTSSTAQLNYILATEDNFETEITTRTGEYIWILVPYGVDIKEIIANNAELILESTDMGTLTVGVGTFQCYRSCQKLIAKNWHVNVVLDNTQPHQIKNITINESKDANIVNNTLPTYGGVVSIKPTVANIQSVFESFPDSNKILTLVYSKSKTLLDADKYYLYAVPGVRTLVVKYPTTNDIILDCDSGFVSLNGHTYSYVIVEKSSTPWYFEIEANLPSEEIPVESLYAYGVQWDKTAESPTCTRIGNMALHGTLPIQNKIKGCLLDDNGNVVKYLPDSGWTEETLDGSAGQVMVELPEFWWKFTESGNTQSVMLSQVPLIGYKHVRKSYVSAYEATFDRGTDATGGNSHQSEWKMASVKNVSTRYRGGNNSATNDANYKSLLGMAASSLDMSYARTAARLRKPSTYEWNLYTYQQHKAIWWLFVVEYATRNTQTAVSTNTTVSGYKQGGLGNGVTTVNWDSWTAFNGSYPFVPIGVTDSLGNGSGEVEYVSYSGDGATWATVMVPRYRGIENPFGHIFKTLDGISVVVTSGDTGESKIYLSDKPFIWNGTNVNGYYHVGNEARNSGTWIREIFFGDNGDIWCTTEGGSNGKFYSDQHYCNVSSSGLRVFRVGGCSANGAFAGLVFSFSNYAPSAATANAGFRLCFIPDETL